MDSLTSSLIQQYQSAKEWDLSLSFACEHNYFSVNGNETSKTHANIKIEIAGKFDKPSRVNDPKIKPGVVWNGNVNLNINVDTNILFTKGDYMINEQKYLVDSTNIPSNTDYSKYYTRLFVFDDGDIFLQIVTGEYVIKKSSYVKMPMVEEHRENTEIPTYFSFPLKSLGRYLILPEVFSSINIDKQIELTVYDCASTNLPYLDFGYDPNPIRLALLKLDLNPKLKDEGKVIFKILDDLTDEPLEGVEVEIENREGIKNVYVTDSNGEIKIGCCEDDTFIVLGIKEGTVLESSLSSLS